MKYELRYKNPPKTLEEMFLMRGVKNLTDFYKPTERNYLEPTLLDHMQDGVELIDKYINSPNPIDLIVD